MAKVLPHHRKREQQPEPEQPAVQQVNVEEWKATALAALGLFSMIAGALPGQFLRRGVLLLQQLVSNTDAVKLAATTLQEAGLVGEDQQETPIRDCCSDEALIPIADAAQYNLEAMMNCVQYLRDCDCDPCPPIEVETKPAPRHHQPTRTERQPTPPPPPQQRPRR